MASKRARIGIGAALALAALLAVLWNLRLEAPEELRVETEERLAQLLRGRVRIDSLHLYPRLGLRLEADGVEVWPADGGPLLRAERVVADVRPYAHLTGQRHLRRLQLEDVRFLVTRDAKGHWAPPPAARVLEREDDAERPAHPDELLGPLTAAEAVVRFLLTRARVADRVEVRGGELRVEEAAPERWIVAADVEASLHGRLLQRRTDLFARARLRDAAGSRGSFEVRGTLAGDGSLQLSLTAGDTDVALLEPYLRELRPDAKLTGSVSGGLELEAPAPGEGRFGFDLEGYEVRSRFSAPDSPADFEAEHAELSGNLAISPGSVHLEDARLVIDELDLELEGTAERPLHGGSKAELALAAHNVTLTEARHMIGWLPEVRREEAEALLATLESGRLELLRTGGTATLSGWQGFLAGRTGQLPHNFVVDARLASTTVRVGDSDRLEALRGRLWWAGDRLEVRGARGKLNGSPLPELDLSIEGVSQLFASEPEARRISSGAPPLSGLGPLWGFFNREPSEEGGPRIPELRLEIEHLEHPMFLWPLAGVEASIESIEGGVRIAAHGGRLAGVPVEATADWLFEPGERVNARLVARTLDEPAGARAGDGPWARGRFELGPQRDGRWRQAGGGGRFEAEGGTVRIVDAELELLPTGRAELSAGLDLGQPADVPFELGFAVSGGDVSSLMELVGMPVDFATGRADIEGSLRGALDPATPIGASLEGTVAVDAHDGTLRKALPAFAAVALASEMFNPFARREEIRFERVTTRMRFGAGRLETDGLAIDGPDVRTFAAGGIDLADPDRELDVELVLFLFRPVDTVVQKIPLLNLLLLGNNDNLVATYFELTGPWADPDARLMPLRSFATGPASLVFETLPGLVQRGLEALGGPRLPAEDLAEKEHPPQPLAAPAES